MVAEMLKTARTLGSQQCMFPTRVHISGKKDEEGGATHVLSVPQPLATTSGDEGEAAAGRGGGGGGVGRVHKEKFMQLSTVHREVAVGAQRVGGAATEVKFFSCALLNQPLSPV
jgi:hypothetical protein